MNNYIKKYEYTTILTMICNIVLGVLLLLFTDSILQSVIYISGGFFILHGIINMITYLTLSYEERVYSNGILEGLLEIFAGSYILLHPNLFLEMIPVILGIWVIYKGIVKLQLSTYMTKVIEFNWVWILIVSLIQIIFGLLMILHPFEALFVTTQYVGILLIVTSIVEGIETIYVLKGLKKQVRLYL